MLAIQMECKLRVIHGRRFPALRRVASRTLRTELTLVSIICLVAGETILRCAFEDAIDMTTLAGNSGMFAIQLKCELGMIHLRQTPAFRRMTSCAIGSKLTVVMVIFQMAGCARLRGGLQVVEVMCIRMTGRTFHRRMFADQVERHLVMVKVCSKRFNAIVTGHAVCPEGQEVFRGECLINLQMAVTTGRLIERISISLYVAVFTGKGRAICLCLMRSQFECNCVVVESGRTPAIGIVTCSTLITQRPGVRIILGVAGGAVHWRALEDTIDMTARTSSGGMLAIKMEGKFRMIHHGGLPAIRYVTGSALIAELTVVSVVLGMA